MSLEHLKGIIEIQLVNLRKRLSERKLSINLTNNAKELLAKEGYDPTYGARPLKRAIQRMIQDPLALKLLSGEFVEGDTIMVDGVKGGMVFRKG